MPLTRSTVPRDTDDLPIVQAPGSAAPASALHVAGQDGSNNLQALLVDTTGAQVAVGAAADGAAAVGNPVQIGGVDGSSNVQALLTDTGGRLEVNTQNTPSGTAALSNVASSVATGVLLAANANRLGAMIVNDGNQNLYVAFAATATTTAYTIKLPSNATWEVPFGYTGVISGIWDPSANGAARMTEFTA